MILEEQASSLPSQEAAGSPVMALDQVRNIHSQKLTFLYNRPPVDDIPIDTLRRAEHQRGNRVVQRAGITQPVQVNGDQISALTRL